MISINVHLTHHTLRCYTNKPRTDSHCWTRAPPDVTYKNREIMTYMRRSKNTVT